MRGTIFAAGERRILNHHPSLPTRLAAFREQPKKTVKSVSLLDKLPPIQDQQTLGCHDATTEVLTEVGWQQWPEYDGRSALGTMNPLSGALEFQIPLALQRLDYDGLLYYIDHRSLDFALTPNHRMFVRPWVQSTAQLSDTYQFTTIDKIGWTAGLPLAPRGWAGVDLDVVHIGERQWTGDDLIALLALVASDGWVGGTASNWNVVSFCCFRKDRQEMVQQFAQRNGLHCVPGRPGVWKFTDAALAHWLRANMFTANCLEWRSPFKRVPAIVKCASARQIRLFLQFFGDQHVDSDGARQFYTSSYQMADDIQELLLRVGKRASFYERKPRSVTMADGRRIEADNCVADITINERSSNRLSIRRNADIKQDNYRGEVFCATVPNSLLVTRRNGSVLISGNSCTAFSFQAPIWVALATAGKPQFLPSTLFQYYVERMVENTVSEDAGCSMHDILWAAHLYGICPQEEWPYVIDKFAQRPPEEAFTAAARERAHVYAPIPLTADRITSCLELGYPIMIGISVYESFENVGEDGVIPMPGKGEQLLGGHAVNLVGVNRTSSPALDIPPGHCLMRNSWSTRWGVAGYGYIPLAYVTDPTLASDAWMIRTI